jgi:hypothetical protein
MQQENKHAKFKRLAKARGERVLKDLRLIANLGNQKNYDYTDADVRALFNAIEEELRLAKYSFNKDRKREINL